MRKIAYYLSEEERYKEHIFSFCQSEGLEGINLAEPGNTSSGCIFFITDREETMSKVDSENTPICLISSSSKLNRKCFIVNEKFCVPGMRIVMDQIHHSGSLWSAVSKIEFGASIKEYIIGNKSAEIERVVCFTTRDFINYCSFAEIEKIRIGFSEMLNNAIEHGNLNITGDEKFEATEAGTYQELLRERETDPRYKDRTVHFWVDFNAERVLITIKDEGNGFDVSKIPSPNDTEHLMKLHGRGILIARAYFDEVNYYGKGNEVKLWKIFGR